MLHFVLETYPSLNPTFGLSGRRKKCRIIIEKTLKKASSKIKRES